MLTEYKVLGHSLRLAHGFLNKPLALKHLAVALLLFGIPYVIPRMYPPSVARYGGPNKGLELKTLISQVKDELSGLEHERIARNELAVFELKQFDLELNFVVRDNSRVTGHGGVPDLVAVDSETQIGSERVQKVILRMTTVPPLRGSSSSPMDSADLSSSEGKMLGKTPPAKKGSKP